MAAVQNHQKPQRVICTHTTVQGGVSENKVNRILLSLELYNNRDCVTNCRTSFVRIVIFLF